MGEWNHYYVSAINGEIRLWVNGEEVSGGNEITPAWGYLCLESEGAPVLGMGLIEGFVLTIEAREGGTVTLERLLN